jgi:hypothetical protein
MADFSHSHLGNHLVAMLTYRTLDLMHVTIVDSDGYQSITGLFDLDDFTLQYINLSTVQWQVYTILKIKLNKMEI